MVYIILKEADFLKMHCNVKVVNVSTNTQEKKKARLMGMVDEKKQYRSIFVIPVFFQHPVKYNASK